MKKTLSLILSLTIFLCASCPGFALNKNNYPDIVEEMIQNGISKEDAFAIYKYGEDMENTGSKRSFNSYIEEKNNTSFEETHEYNIEEALEIIKDEMKNNPGKKEYKVNLNSNSWVKCTTEWEYLGEDEEKTLNDEQRSFYGIREKEVKEEVLPWKNKDGSYKFKHQFTIKDGTWVYMNSWVEQKIKVSENGERIKVIYARGGGGAAGAVKVRDDDNTYIHVEETARDEDPREWCFVEQKTDFEVTASLSAVGKLLGVGSSFGGSFSLHAILKTSLFAVHYINGFSS